LDFDSRFFLASAILSLLTGVLYHSYTWLLYLHIIELPVSWLWLAIEPAKIFVGVFLSFGVMYILTTRGKPAITQALFVIVFLGCWLGRLVAFAIHTYVVYSNGISDLFHFTLTAMWEIFASLFSITLFVSLAAILFAYYQERQHEQVSPKQEEVHA
jgi:hypothetical protein